MIRSNAQVSREREVREIARIKILLDIAEDHIDELGSVERDTLKWASSFLENKIRSYSESFGEDCKSDWFAEYTDIITGKKR